MAAGGGGKQVCPLQSPTNPLQSTGEPGSETTRTFQGPRIPGYRAWHPKSVMDGRLSADQSLTVNSYIDPFLFSGPKRREVGKSSFKDSLSRRET